MKNRLFWYEKPRQLESIYNPYIVILFKCDSTVTIIDYYSIRRVQNKYSGFLPDLLQPECSFPKSIPRKDFGNFNRGPLVELECILPWRERFNFKVTQ